MNVFDVMPIQPVNDFRGYSALYYGVSKVGKSTLVQEIYGDRVFNFFSEPRYKHLIGASVFPCQTWKDLINGLKQMKNPKMKARFDYIALDTIDNFFPMLEKYTIEEFDEEKLGDAAWGADWTFMKSEWYDMIDSIFRMGYIPIFVGHESTVTKKIPVKGMLPEDLEEAQKNGKLIEDEDTKEQYLEFEYAQPNIKDKYLEMINGKVDMIIHLAHSMDSKGREVRVAHLRGSVYYSAGCSVQKGVDLPETVLMDSQVIEDTFNQAFEKAYGDKGVSLDEQKEAMHIEDEVTFEELKASVTALGKELQGQKRGKELKEAIVECLGEGKKVSEATEKQFDRLRELKEKLENLLK